MNQDSERASLDDVLDAYAISEPGPGYVSLAEWIHRYPYYEQELTAFTADWVLATWLPTPTSIHNVDEEVLVLHGMSIVQDILQQQKTALQDELHPLLGIVQEGTHLGLSLQEIAERAQMSVALVRKLDRRLIRAGSIPQQAIDSLAQAIQRGSLAVAAYLQGEPVLPYGASYRAEQAPALAEPQDFFEAVRSDMGMLFELRERWLSYAPPDAR